MPSQTRSWITLHPPLALLHVTSDDPRRAGCEDLAMFEMDLVPLLEIYKYRIRNGVIQNEFGGTLLTLITSIRKMGRCQIEPNCDFTKDNLTKRPGPEDNRVEHILKYREGHPDWRTREKEISYFSAVPYKTTKDTTSLIIRLVDGGRMTIIVNKCLAHKVPRELVYRPQRKFNKLFLPPNRAQSKRNKYNNDMRHGRALTTHLLEAAGCAAARHTRLKHYNDYTIDFTNGDFEGSLNIKNHWLKIEGLGSVLKIVAPAYYHRPTLKRNSEIWESRPAHMYPNDKEYLKRSEDKIGYYLIDENLVETVKEYLWAFDTIEGKHEPYCVGSMDWNKKELPRPPLKLIICEASGNQMRNVFVQSRLNKYYEATLGSTDKKRLKSRARFENMIACEKNGNNAMYTKARIISRKHIHLEKHIEIKLTDTRSITALDMRMQSIRIGGNKA